MEIERTREAEGVVTHDDNMEECVGWEDAEDVMERHSFVEKSTHKITAEKSSFKPTSRRGVLGKTISKKGTTTKPNLSQKLVKNNILGRGQTKIPYRWFVYHHILFFYHFGED